MAIEPQQIIGTAVVEVVPRFIDRENIAGGKPALLLGAQGRLGLSPVVIKQARHLDCEDADCAVIRCANDIGLVALKRQEFDIDACHRLAAGIGAPVELLRAGHRAAEDHKNRLRSTKGIEDRLARKREPRFLKRLRESLAG